MRTALLPLLLTLTTLPVVTSVSRADTPRKKEDAAPAIAVLHAQMDSAFVQRDASAFMKPFADDATSSRDGKTLTKAEIEKGIRDMLDDAQTVTSTTQLRYFTQSDNVVSVIATRKLSITYAKPPSGMPQPLKLQIVQQETWSKTADEWHLLRLNETPLTAQLKEMARQDQEGRFKLLNDSTDKALLAQMVQIDVENMTRIKQLLAISGWPLYSQVGTEAGHDAWLIIQHADSDRPFQEQCLRMLGDAVKKEEASGSDLAYLTDRVRVNSGKLQVYGTQFMSDASGALVPRPMEDPANVDKRRASVGLSTMSEYKKQMAEVYKQPVK